MIGRQVTRAQDPRRACEEILVELGEAHRLAKSRLLLSLLLKQVEQRASIRRAQTSATVPTNGGVISPLVPEVMSCNTLCCATVP